MITGERLRELLAYSPETGVFTWRISRPGGVKKGDRAGCLNPYTGYRQIGVDGQLHSEQRLAWLYMTGEWPALEVDHRDRHRSNNAWSNLREATKSQQAANSSLRVDNTSGVKGVSWFAPRGLWYAQIQVDRVKISLGYSRSKTIAKALYQRAAREHFGEFAA